MKQTSRLILVSALLALSACAGPEGRIKKNQGLFSSYPPETQEDIRAGRVRIGFTKDQTLMALGEPDYKYARTTESGFREVWIYSDPDIVPPGSAFRRSTFGPAARADEDIDAGKARIVFDDGKLSILERRL